MNTESSATLVAQAKSILADAYVAGYDALAKEQALDFYIDGAQAGVPGSMYGLGCWYEGSNPRFGSSSPDCELAAEFFEAGAVAGSVRCAIALARLHLRGCLRHSDQHTCMQLLRAATAQGDRSAAAMLSEVDRQGLRGQLLRRMRTIIWALRWPQDSLKKVSTRLFSEVQHV